MQSASQTMSPSPIKNKIGAVFIHVRDTERSANFYHRLFGYPDRHATYEVIHSIRMGEDSSGIVLDQITHNMNRSERPMFMLDTDDVRASYRYVKKLGYEIVWGIEDHGSMAFFAFRDPDGNLLMVCGTPGDPSAEDGETDVAADNEPLGWAGPEWSDLESLKTAAVERTAEGLRLQGRIRTADDFRTPLRIEADLRTDGSAVVELLYGSGTVLLNGGTDRKDLISQHPCAAKRTVFRGKGGFKDRTWLNVVWEISELEMKLWIDGELRHSQRGDFRGVLGKPGIYSSGGRVEIKRFAAFHQPPVYQPAQLEVTKAGEPFGLLVPSPGTVSRMEEGALWLTNNREPALAFTTASFRPPFACEAVVAADLNNMTLRAGAGVIRFIDGHLGIIDRAGKETWFEHGGALPQDGFFTVKWTAEAGRMSVAVGGVTLGEAEGSFHTDPVQAGIGADIGSVVLVRSLDIREL